MSQITIHSNPINTIGNLPAIGSKAPEFVIVGTDLAPKTLADYSHKTIILNVFPSLDTETCANSVRTFNKQVGQLEDTVVLCVSKDLPFAHARFCTTEGLTDVVGLSDFRTTDFGEAYGLTLIDGPLQGLLARAVIIIQEGIVVYTQLVPEITAEPNYQEVLEFLK